MSKALLEGHTSYKQHEYLKALARKAHQTAIDLGIAHIDGDDDHIRRLILDLTQDTHDLEKWLDALTEKGGYERFQGYLDQLKIGNGRR